MRRKKPTDQYREEKRWVFSFDLNEATEDACQTFVFIFFLKTKNKTKTRMTARVLKQDPNT